MLRRHFRHFLFVLLCCFVTKKLTEKEGKRFGVCDGRRNTSIRFCVELETLQMLRKGQKHECRRSLVFKWHDRFKYGRESLQDDERPECPKSVSNSVKGRIVDLLGTDRRVTVRSVAYEVETSLNTVHKILREELSMRKVNTQWVPRLLSKEDRSRRLAALQEFLSRFEEEEVFLRKIFTTDETWLSHYESESKLQSSVWNIIYEPQAKKARFLRSCGKPMFVFFIDYQGMVLQHEVPEGQKVNAEYDSKVLRRELVQALRKKRPGLDLLRVILHKDNAHAHKASSTLLEINLLEFETIVHPPIAQMDFRVFPEIVI